MILETLELAERLAASQTWLDGLSDRLQPGTGRDGST
jgi:hypothetical protein